jgi:hypothetical protein
LNEINDWNFITLLLSTFKVLLTNQCPELVEIDRWTEVVVAIEMEISHTNFSKVSRMIFVEVYSMMMHTTSITTSTGMLAMFS